MRAIFYVEGEKINAVDCVSPVLKRLEERFPKGSIIQLPDDRVEVILDGSQGEITAFHQHAKENIYAWLAEEAGGEKALKKMIGNPGITVSALKFNHRLPSFDIALFNGKMSWQRLYDRGLKRAMDFCIAGIGLLAISPLLALLAVFVKLGSKGPVLYSQERVGLKGKPFKLWKFRTMRENAEKETGPVWASHVDPRITRLGYLMRRTNLDELPQLFNVLNGNMSLIGPRPERPYFIERFRHKYKDYDKRHLVRPGMTGWAQVNGFYGNTSLEKRLEHDLAYIERECLLFDLKILKDTAKMFWGDLRTHLPKHLKKKSG